MAVLIAVIFLGLFFWLGNLHVLILGRDWPLILIFLGLLQFFDFSHRSAKQKILNDLEKARITPVEAEEKLKQL
ncbi:MAG TPA: hypothetical protein VF399_01630 [bacterium]